MERVDKESLSADLLRKSPLLLTPRFNEEADEREDTEASPNVDASSDRRESPSERLEKDSLKVLLELKLALNVSAGSLILARIASE